MELAAPEPVAELDKTADSEQKADERPVVSMMIPRAKGKAKEKIVHKDSDAVCSTLILRKEAWKQPSTTQRFCLALGCASDLDCVLNHVASWFAKAI